MSLDDIDLDSWGKATDAEVTGSEQSSPSDTTAPPSDAKKKRKRSGQTGQTGKSKRLTAFVLKEAMLSSKLSMGGRRALQRFLKRNVSDDVAVPTFVLEVVRELLENGYEL